MYKFGEKHPIGLEIILIIVSFLVSGVIVVACSIVNMHADLSTSIARIFVALVLLVIYRRAFTGQNIFTNPVILIPSLLFAAWNVFYNLSSGMVFGGSVFFIEAAITAIAPALFEEVIFRGIFIYNLKKKGSSDLSCLFITAAMFSVVHLLRGASYEFGWAEFCHSCAADGLFFRDWTGAGGGVFAEQQPGAGGAGAFPDRLHKPALCGAGDVGFLCAAGHLCGAAGCGGGVCGLVDGF